MNAEVFKKTVKDTVDGLGQDLALMEKMAPYKHYRCFAGVPWKPVDTMFFIPTEDEFETEEDVRKYILRNEWLPVPDAEVERVTGLIASNNE